MTSIDNPGLSDRITRAVSSLLQIGLGEPWLSAMETRGLVPTGTLAACTDLIVSLTASLNSIHPRTALRICDQVDDLIQSRSAF